MRKLLIFLLGFVLVMPACAPPERDVAVHERHNYIILLDLSDRLIKQPDQVERDKALIKEIYTMFEEHVKQDLYIRSKDAIKIVLAYQEASPVESLIAEDKLFINMEKIYIKDRKKLESERRSKFFSSLDELYKSARFSKNTGDYKGADIGKYFEEDIRRDLIGGDDVTNYVFVLTDGYMYVEGKQTGLNDWRTINKSFDNLSVMLLETDPVNRDNEWDKMQRAWVNWFSKMGVRNVVIEKRTAFAKVNELMKKFVEQGNEQLGYNLIDVEQAPPQPNRVHVNSAKENEVVEKKAPALNTDAKDPSSKNDKTYTPEDSIAPDYYDEPVTLLINGKAIANHEKIYLFDRLTAASSFYPPYFWNFGDGSLDQNSGKHTYDHAGRFKLTLKRPDGLILATREIYVSSLSRPVEKAFKLLDNILKNRHNKINICDMALQLHQLKNNQQLVFELVDETEKIKKYSLQDFISYLCQQSKIPFSKIDKISSDPVDGGLQTITLRK